MSKPSGLKVKEQIKKEDIKQAVIVDYKAIGCRTPDGRADSKPFIRYSLEWLLIEQFDEVYVCCLPDNVQQIRELVKLFQRTENVPASMTIQVHSSEHNRSTGDCLRDLDAKALIKTDFVIMDVGCCGNLPLAELLQAHKNLKKVDRSVLLTSIVRNLFTKNPAEISEFPIYITDPRSGLLLHYVSGRVSESESSGTVVDKIPKKSIEVPSEIFLERDSVKIHTNLCSTNLSIYSTNVPAEYAELFDCHSEAEFIQASFDNKEVLGGSVYIHIVDDLFSQRMADFGFAINQRKDKFDTNLLYKRSDRCQVLRKLVNDSLIDCTRLNTEEYLSNLPSDDSVDSETESESEDPVTDDEDLFLHEVLDSLVRGYEETIQNKNLVLEVNSSKHAYYISIDDVYETIAHSLLMLPHKLTNTPTNVSEYSNIVETSIDKFNEFLLNYIKSDESRKIFLSAMEDKCLLGELKFLNDVVLAKVFYKLYEIDVLDEDSILRWFQEFDKANEPQRTLREKPNFKKLRTFLEAEPDSSSEEDDD